MSANGRRKDDRESEISLSPGARPISVNTSDKRLGPPARRRRSQAPFIRYGVMMSQTGCQPLPWALPAGAIRPAVEDSVRNLAQLAYRMLRYGQAYVDIGEAAYEARYQARRIAALRNSATKLGFTLIPANEAA